MIILLTAIWVILRESVTITTVLVGFAVSAGCVLFSRRLVPMKKTEPVKPLWLVVYFFYLIGRIYVGGIGAMKVIFFGAHVEIVTIKTSIKSRLLRTILVNSITLVPGSIALDLTDDVITVLWLIRDSDGPPDVCKADEQLKGRLEHILLRAETACM